MRLGPLEAVPTIMGLAIPTVPGEGRVIMEGHVLAIMVLVGTTAPINTMAPTTIATILQAITMAQASTTITMVAATAEDINHIPN